MAGASRLRVGINGFGRIGRAIARINFRRHVFDVVAVNDINPDIHNLAYLLKYDSTYGRLSRDVQVKGTTLVPEGFDPISVYTHRDIDAVPWKAQGVEVVIDVGGSTRKYQVTATRAGRRVEVATRRGLVEVTEVTRTGTPVRTARFMASRIVSLVEYPAADEKA